MQIIHVPGSSVTLPQACACCLGLARHTCDIEHSSFRYLGGGLSRTRKLSLKVPYCADCIQHVNWARNAAGNYVALFMAVALAVFAGLGIGLVATVVIMGSGDNTLRNVVAIAVGLVPPVYLGVKVGRALKNWSTKKRSPGLGHAFAGDAIAIDHEATDLRPDMDEGMARTLGLMSVTLRVYNPGYAQMILSTNEGSSIIEEALALETRENISG